MQPIVSTVTQPVSVTAYILTLNEARQLRDVLAGIRWANEIIVVDSHSTDGTVGIAQENGARVINQDFCGFGRLRNQALDAAGNDWIFSIDADERCTPELADEIRRELTSPKFDAYFVPRRSHFLGRWIRHSGWYPDYRQPQLFNRRKFRYREDVVHESFECAGRCGYLREHVMQYPWATLAIATEKLHRYSTLMAQRYAADKKRATLTRLLGSPLAMFVRVYVVQQGFRDGRHGLVLAALYSYYTFLKYAKLWELQQKERPRS